MNRRLLLGVGLLAVLVATAGCSTILGPGEPDAEQLNRDVSYDWDETGDRNVTVNITRSEYRAIYRVENRSQIELYRQDALGTEHPLDLTGLTFQYANGTTTRVNASEDDNFSVELTRQRAVVSLPDEDGKLAFSSSRNGKSWAMPTFIEGRYAVTLPESARVGVPLLGQVSPGADATTVEDDRVTITWNDVSTRNVSVRWYLTRDLWLFGGLAGLGLLVGGAGLLYYLRQIRQLERQREEVGLNMDIEDDRDDPPPGMG